MDKRLKKIERMLAIQQKMHRLAEWKLADLDRQKADLAESEARLFGALNDDEHLQGIFVEAMARRLAALARDADRLKREREAQNQRLTEAGLKMKRTERMGRRLRRDSRKEAEKRGFAELLETLVKPDDASLP